MKFLKWYEQFRDLTRQDKLIWVEISLATVILILLAFLTTTLTQ